MASMTAHVRAADAGGLIGRLRGGFWTKATALAALVALGDRLFFVRDGAGSALGVFALVCLAMLAATRPAIGRNAQAVVAALLGAGYAFILADDPNPLALLLFATAFASAALLPRTRFRDAWSWSARLFAHGITAPFAIPLDLRRLAHLPRRRRAGLRGAVPLLALPVIGGAVFLALFAQANPLISDALSGFRLPELDERTFGRIFLWLVLAVLLWSAFRPRAVGWTLRPATAAHRPLAGVSPASVTLSLLVFNALFGLQNALDLAFLWSGAGLPDGLTLADYAHRGAYPLIATALLAGAFVLVALRPGSPTDTPLVRRLVTVWVAQNIFLVASAALRTLDYIDVYSLTRLRITALAWMALVAAGLALIGWRLLRGRSAAWLINANAACALLVLSAASAIDLGSVAAHWNVRHAREVGGRGAALDLCYLGKLGPSALTALVDLEHRRLAPAFRDRVRWVRRNVLDQTRRQQASGDRTWRNARRLQQIDAPAIGSLRPPEAAGSGRNCDGTYYAPPPSPPTPTPPAPPPAPLTKAPRS